MKKQSIAILCIAILLAVFMAACSPKTPPEEESKPVSATAAQVPNPITEYDTIEEAEAAAGFSVKLPTALPKGYAVSRIAVIAGAGEPAAESGGGIGGMGGGATGHAVVEVTWTDGTNTLVYRVAKEQGADLSGDYTEYAEKDTLTLGEWTVHTRGEEGRVNVATWSADGFDHALSAHPGSEVSQIESIIASMQ